MNVVAILEVPPVALLPNIIVQSKALRPMRFATGGTILAAELAMRPALDSQARDDDHMHARRSDPVAPFVVPPLGAAVASSGSINLGGGYHHCSARSGDGFYPYADISLAILMLHKKHAVERAMLVDLDAHQGNGHERDKLDGVFARAGVEVFILDAFNPSIYPHGHHARAAIDVAIELSSGTGDEEYLSRLRAQLPRALDRFRPQVVIYNAGTNIVAGDPLGRLSLTPAGMIQRDEEIFRACAARGIPVVMLLSGGYPRSNAAIIAQSIATLQRKMQLWTPASQMGGASTSSSMSSQLRQESASAVASTSHPSGDEERKSHI